MSFIDKYFKTQCLKGHTYRYLIGLKSHLMVESTHNKILNLRLLPFGQPNVGFGVNVLLSSLVGMVQKIFNLPDLQTP